MKNKYGNFAVMMAVSFVSMYFIMFLNIFEISHYYNSITRVYMTLLMIAPMALIMLFFMKDMYNNSKINAAIIASCVVGFTLVFLALRSQFPVGDVQYMKAMIPHHSSAILTSERADIQDPEVRKLADDIIKAQVKEIAEMKALIQKLENK
ncbi:DUF305 domain-containing protein [Candidatus Gracilibacteria bacterium]|nr:DUF305 domain-containing protein [Candidatus Gracilibacteria bacterium]